MFFCSNCGAELTEGTAFCTSCGAAQNQAAAPAEPETTPVSQPVVETPVNAPATAPAGPEGPAKTMGIISLVCGILSLVSCCGGPLFGITAIILSVMAKKKAEPGVKNTLATVGLYLGIAGIAIGVISGFIGFITGLIGGLSGY